MRLTFGYRDTNDLFHSFALLFVFFGRLNGIMLESDLAFLLVIGMSALGILLRIRTLWGMPKRYLAWLVGFLVLFLTSTGWAMNPSRTFTNFVATLGRTFVVLYAFTHMNSIEGIRKVINVFLLAVVLNSAFILVVFGPSALIEARTLEIRTAAGNNNSIGMSAAYAVILSWYFSNPQRKKKPLMLVTYVFLLLIVLLTGSKKALLLLALAVALMYFLTHKNKLTVVMMIGIAVVAGYFLLLNVPFLYLLIGNRIEAMVNGILSMFQLENLTSDNLINTTLDKSDRLRFTMILKGLEFFQQKPFLGYGMANYADLYSGMYSHNNYIEIAVGLGSVGLMVYYSLHVYVICKTWKDVRENLNAAVALTLVLLLMILDIGLVSYLELYTQITLAIAVSLCSETIRNSGSADKTKKID